LGAVAIFLGGALHAQSGPVVLGGEKANDRYGASLRLVDDLTGDGVSDYIVGAPENAQPFSQGEGYARIYDGVSGAVVRTLNGSAIGFAYGGTVGNAGDVNGDGRGDVLIASQQAGGLGEGAVEVRSGANGGLLRTVVGIDPDEQLGHALEGLGDVTGDGVPDFAASSINYNTPANPRGIVRAFNGANGAPLWSVQGTAGGARFGSSLANMGDINGDGRADLLVGSYFGGAKLLSGANGNVLWSVANPVSGDRLGVSVCSVPDANNDGIRDCALGATQEGSLFGPGAGYVQLRSGATGALLRTINGAQVGDRFGSSLAGLPDVDGDGVGDLLIGADQAILGGSGYAKLVSGATGVLLHSIAGQAVNERYGLVVASLGDRDGDGKQEFAVAAPSASTTFVFGGRVDIWESDVVPCLAPTSYCVAAPNSTGSGAQISGIGTTSIAANDFGLRTTNLPANAVGLYFMGTTTLQQPFGNGFRCVGGSIVRLPIINADASGVAQYILNQASLPAGSQPQPGDVRRFQFWYRNVAAGGAGFNLSNGLEARFCN
jgi:hypothetical protein